jgi:Tat protein translocase TatC
MVTLDDPSVRAAYEQREELPRMSFGDHLDELRKRLWRALIAVVVAVMSMLPFHDAVMRIITKPYRILWREAFADYVAKLEASAAKGELTDEWMREMLRFCRDNSARILDGTFPERFVSVLPARTGFAVPYTLMASGGVEDFWTFLMASLVFAAVLASPVVIWQAWAFIAAGLYERERKVFYRFFPFMMVLLAAGVLFGCLFAVPYGLGFLIRLQLPGVVSSMLTVGNYFNFLFLLTTAMGVVFQLPMVMVALQRIGLVRHRTFVKQWRYAVLSIFAIAMLITPPDPFSMMLMALPMMGLYGLGLVLTRFGRKHERPEDGTAAAVTP